MKRIVVSILGVSLLSSALFAAGDHMGDHMHGGKMMNHMNPNGEVSSKMQMMDHDKMMKMHEECQAFMKSQKSVKETATNEHLKLLKDSFAPDEFAG